MSNQCFITRRGGGSFNKSVMFVTAPSGSTVTMQNMVRSDNLVSDVQYQEAATKDLSCVTIKQCGEVSKGDRIRVSLEVTTSEDAIGYWASESGLITDKREVNLKSGKQTITLDITAFGNLNLDTKFFCKGDESEATITAANLQFYKYTVGTTLKTATEKNGVWRFNGLDVGLWLIKAEKESETPATQEFEIKEFGVYRVTLAFRLTPEFTYTGDYEVVDDDDQPIEDFAGWKDNWKIRFLTSGTFTVTNMYGWDGKIDVFAVGGGAGGGQYGRGYSGGGGGYTNTKKNTSISVNVPYTITIGAGGATGTNGGNTSGFDLVANGGYTASGPSVTGAGGNGGNGGGGGANSSAVPKGGKGGSDGNDGGKGVALGGKGQISTPGPNGETGNTREFGDISGTLYAGGGGGIGTIPGEGGENGGGDGESSSSPAQNGDPNTGGGGGGGSIGTSGGSGIVIIRNAREVA